MDIKKGKEEKCNKRVRMEEWKLIQGREKSEKNKKEKNREKKGK